MIAKDQSTNDALRARIGDLERQSELDQQLVQQLEAEGVIDRTRIVGLESALQTCRRIGAAMGILMVTQMMTEEQAFEALRLASQQSQRRLRDLADDVVRSGTLG
jgi:AmiR/NasT family two-component response regulator